MKKRALLLVAAVAIIITTTMLSTNTYSNPNGAPAGASGAPNDPANGCARSGCHSGTPSSRDSLLTSNIPSTGYVPGQTYAFNVRITQAGISKWGFQVSPQSENGTLLGTIALTNSSQTRLAAGGGGKYVTHTTAGNSGSTGSKSWTFNWTAPATGSGAVNFYAFVMAANGNGITSGDQCFKETVIYQEAADVGFNVLNNNTFELFPNPSATGFFILKGLTTELNLVKMFDINGKLVFNELLASGNKSISTAGFEKGVYFVSIEGKQGRIVKKLIIQ